MPGLNPVLDAHSSAVICKLEPASNVKETCNSFVSSLANRVPSESGGYETMGGGVYDSSKMNQIMSRKGGGDLATSFGVDPTAAPDFLTKDYTKVMKAIDKKKGKSNG